MAEFGTIKVCQIVPWYLNGQFSRCHSFRALGAHISLVPTQFTHSTGPLWQARRGAAAACLLSLYSPTRYAVRCEGRGQWSSFGTQQSLQERPGNDTARPEPTTEDSTAPAQHPQRNTNQRSRCVRVLCASLGAFCTKCWSLKIGAPFSLLENWPFKYHGTIWHTFIVPNSAIPNFAYSQPPPPPPEGDVSRRPVTCGGVG